MYEYDFRECQLKARIETLEKKNNAIGEASFETRITSAEYFTAEKNVKFTTQISGDNSFVIKNTENDKYIFQKDGIYLCLIDLNVATTEEIGADVTIKAYRKTNGVRGPLKTRVYHVSKESAAGVTNTNNWAILNVKKLDEFDVTIASTVSANIKYGTGKSMLTIIKIK